MSSTRKGKRHGGELDDFPTPRWCVHRLLECKELILPSGLWIEPCAGAGNIIRGVNEVRDDISWHANELNPVYEEALLKFVRTPLVRIGDVLTFDIDHSAKVIITNPPFCIAEDVLHRCMMVPGAVVVILQRLNWCAGPRSEIFRQFKPSVFVLPQRPSFRDVYTTDPKTGKTRMSSTDSIEYAWFVFDWRGHFTMLADTPDEVRAAEKKERRALEKKPTILESNALDTSSAAG